MRVPAHAPAARESGLLLNVELVQLFHGLVKAKYSMSSLGGLMLLLARSKGGSKLVDGAGILKSSADCCSRTRPSCRWRRSVLCHQLRSADNPLKAHEGRHQDLASGPARVRDAVVRDLWRG
ncbi:hypothetical protein PR003_g1274 [Phytophthora rubi]|uniref:Uncharacterized protein n=1 Tax=Phytophthora rubi TaxID=129364 RepID=A0A6A3P044_9STRA|nr:hypothetical protein PR001_g3695 [Phytophthora rubi]KAE9358445.1 hypothetical protein PR003_g1274 [Phytophthora rubi]